MTREEAIETLTRHRNRHFSDFGWDKSVYKALGMAISALEQMPCEDIKVGTKVRTTKDKDYCGEEVFPIGTIGIVDRIYSSDKLPYKILANNDYWYYSRDMFEVIEDVEPCEDAVAGWSRKKVRNDRII